MYRIGRGTYGFQGHPELTPDLLFIWSRGWGDEWLSKLTIDIDKDVIGYSRKHKNEIIYSSLILFDIWVDIVLDDDVHDQIPKEYCQIVAQRYNVTARIDEKNASAHCLSITGPTQWALHSAQ